MSELILLLLVGAIALYWQSAVRCKDLAIISAKRECQRHQVQLLDQTVQQVKMSASRDHMDRWRLWREYRFEYTEDGDNRDRGSLVMLGQRIVHIRLSGQNTIIH